MRQSADATLLTFAYTTGGTLAPDAPSYVERQADLDLLSHLKEGETCYVLNSRQMGKSSLCVRTILRLKEASVRTAFLDLTKFGGRNLTAEQWYAALLSEIGRELGLRSEFLGHWKENPEFPPVQRLFGALTEVGLKNDSPVVVFIDEIDVTLSLPFSADEFFAAIRQCYVGRATDERLKRLSFCLLGTATPADLIQDTRVSPFNIGKRIELRDFTAQEAAPLATGLGDAALLDRVLHWTGGHPYLTQRLCQAVMDSKSNDVDKVCSDLFLTQSAKEGDDNLAFVRNRLLKSEADLAALLDLYRKMRSGKSVQDDETNPLCALLKLSGVAKVEGGLLKVRNRIYEHVFDREWVETHMPEAEKRRQKEAYRKGLLRAAAVGFGVVAAIAALAIQAFRAEQVAKSAQKELTYQLYVAKMNNLQILDQEGNSAQMERILEETKNSPHRGWEWGYWNGVLHDAPEEYVLDSPNREPMAVAMFSPDGKQIMIADAQLGVAMLVDRKGRRVVSRYRLSNPRTSTVDRIGSRWVDVDEKGVRDLATGRLLFRSKARDGEISNISFRDGSIVFSELVSDYSGNMKTLLRDAAAGQVVYETGGKFPNYSLISGWSKTAHRIITLDVDQDMTKATLKVLDRSNKVFFRVTTNDVRSVGASPSGRLLHYADKGRLIVYDWEQRRVVSTLDWPKGSVAFIDRNEKHVFYQGDDRRLTVRTILDGAVVAEYKGVRQVFENPKTSELMLCGPTIRIVSLATKRRVLMKANAISRSTKSRFILDNNTGYFYLSDPELDLVGKPTKVDSIMLVSPGGRLRAVFEQTKLGRMSVLRDTESGEALLRSREGWLRVLAPLSGDHFVTFSMDGSTLAGYRRGESVPRWTRTYAKVDLRAFAAMVMSADGSRVLRSLKGELELLDGVSGRVLKRTQYGSTTGIGFVGRTNDFWISVGDGTKFFDGTRLSDQPIQRVEMMSIYSLDLSPDGRRFAAIDSQGGVSIWDAKTKERLARIPMTGSFIGSVLFTSDGKKLIAANQTDGPVVLQSKETASVVRIPVEVMGGDDKR